MTNSGDDSIIILESKNSGDDTPLKDADLDTLKGGVSQKVLEDQGIFVDTGRVSETQETREGADFTQGLLNQGGIEIIPAEKDDFL